MGGRSRQLRLRGPLQQARAPISSPRRLSCECWRGSHRVRAIGGLERTLTVNVISTFLLAILTLPALKATPEKYDTSPNLSLVSSVIHIFGPEAQLQPQPGKDTFKALSDPDTADMRSRYPLSKLIEHLCFLELVPLASKAAPKMTVDLLIQDVA